MKPADLALLRAEWQPLLFDVLPNRAELAVWVDDASNRTVRVRVHGNHGFEPVSSAMRAYAGWNGFAVDCAHPGYDDTLTFDLSKAADIDVVWFDTDRVRSSGKANVGDWLVERLRALRKQTSNAIVTLAWPLSGTERNAVVQAQIPGSHVADLAPLAAQLGERWLDLRASALTGTRLGNQACLRIARELACCWLPAAALPPRKAIVLDLDDTLYRGVLGEDGAAGVQLTPGHRALQARLAAFRDAGILLALVSRNERTDVEALFAARTDFPLRLADFAAIEIGWDDKPGVLRKIAERLRIGEEAMVFVDDNPGELAAVASKLPVFTLHAREDAAETAAALEHVAGLFRWRGSAEDAIRAADLHASQQRSAIAADAASDDDYLASLRVRVAVLVGPRAHIGRLADLSAKTSQFNLSLARMSEADIARRLDEDPANVVAIRLEDRLSDSGIVGLLVGSRTADALHVEEVCVSCRALGRRLESAMLTTALRAMAGERVPGKVVFSPRRGPRNAPARRWLEQYGDVTLSDETTSVAVPFDVVARQPLSSAIRTEVIRCASPRCRRRPTCGNCCGRFFGCQPRRTASCGVRTSTPGIR
jgi:FkbH-like protein